MQNIDTQKYYNAKFSSMSELKSMLGAEQATTTDINFILGVREALLSELDSVTEIDTMLWQLMREHLSITHQDSGMNLVLLSARIASVTWFNRLDNDADLFSTDKAGYDIASNAIIGGSLLIVKKLHEKGLFSQTLKKGKTPYLIEAATSKNPAIFNWLLSHENDSELLKSAFIDFIIKHDEPEIICQMVAKQFGHEECSIEHEGQRINALEIALLNKRHETAKILTGTGMTIQSSSMPSTFDMGKVGCILDSLHSDLESPDLSVNQKVERSLAEMMLKDAIKSEQVLIYPIANHAKTSATLKRLFAITNINPALDIEIDSFNSETQDKIYEIMFV